MKTKKAIIFMILLSVLFVTFGCVQIKGGESSNNVNVNVKAKNPDDKVQKTKIQIARWSLGYEKGLEDAIGLFNKKNKDNIEITLLQLPKFKYTEVLNMLMTSGDGPDIFSINNEWLNTYINRNWALNISDYIDNDFLMNFPDWAVRFAKNPAFRGGFYTIPASLVTSRLIYNKDIFKMAGLDPEKPPVTIEELSVYSLKISSVGASTRKYGLALPLGEEWAGFIQSMEMPLTSSGVYYYDFKEGSYNLNIYKNWLETIVDMKSKGGLYPGENTMKIDTIRAQFAEGNIGMMFATSWEPSVLKNQYSVKCDWGVARPPAIDSTTVGRGKTIILPGVCYVVNPNSPDKGKVMKVWKYLYSEECLGEQFRQGGEIPVQKGIMSNLQYRPDIENYNNFLPNKDDSPYPNVPTGGSEWERFTTYLAAIEKIDSAQNVLDYQAAKLNESFGNKVATRVFDIRDYKNSSFNPLRPLE